MQDAAADRGRAVLSESLGFWEKPAADGKRRGRFDRKERAIFAGNLKFISSTTGKRELYDLREDPCETRNLYQADEPRSAALKAMLDDWVKRTAHGERRYVRPDPRVIEQLRSLGYIQ